MENYKVPASEGEDQLIEKKSRFIGHIYKVETAEEANNIIAAQKKNIGTQVQLFTHIILKMA